MSSQMQKMRSSFKNKAPLKEVYLGLCLKSEGKGDQEQKEFFIGFWGLMVGEVLTSKSFAKVLTFSHSVGRAGNGWEGIFSGLFQIPHNHLDLGGSEIPFFYVRVVALARKGLQEAGRFADFDQKTVVGRLGVVVGIVQLGELAFEYGSVEIHDG